MRDLETGTFITRDPLGFKAGPNMYTYVDQNPWTKFDPLGLEPVKQRAGTIDDFVKVMNDSPSKVGQKTGQGAVDAMKYMGSTTGLLTPKATPYFNEKQGRYVYTEKGGWLDMVHFMFYSGMAYDMKLNGVQDPVSAAVKQGYHQEMTDRLEKGSHSAYSYEDLPSDKMGAIFGAYYFNPLSAKTISEQVKAFVATLEPKPPQEAPNYDSLPEKHTEEPPTATNTTTTPMFTKTKDDNESDIPSMKSSEPPPKPKENTVKPEEKKSK